MNRFVSEIRPSDQKGQKQFDSLLEKTGIKRDRNLDYIAGIHDENYNLIASGACFGNTLRCLAVDEKYQGEGLMAPMVTHLMNYQASNNRRNLFLYTKCANAGIFSSLGFYEVAQSVQDDILLMESVKTSFDYYLVQLAAHRNPGKNAATVMNCNPFTLGHRYLVEQAAAENDALHLFVVSEDLSFFPFADRYRLIAEGCADLSNVILHTTGSYMVSSSVFPSYFMKDENSAIEAQARLDTAIFRRIAQSIGAYARYVGEEPFSRVTGIYNRIMLQQLPLAGLDCKVFPRKEHRGTPISASGVRKLLQEGRIEECKELVPPTTYCYFFSEDGARVIEQIQKAKDVVHY